MHTITRIAAALLLAGGLADLAGAANVNDAYCGELSNAYGPYDFRKGRTDFAANLALVEHAHFNQEVEHGLRGISSTLGGDLDYTLRAFPNHPRALSTMDRAALRDRTFVVRGAPRPAECYFNRALRFAPDDPAVYAVYGNYVAVRGRNEEALKLYAHAVILDPENPTLNYNLGLQYFKAKNFTLANKYAQKAYAAGFPLPGLKNMLTQAGKWDVAAAPPPKPAAPAPDSEPASGAEPAAAQAAEPKKD